MGIRYLDIRETGVALTMPPSILAEVSGIVVTDEADARVKLAGYTPLFVGLTYEAFYHRHFHSEILGENQPCQLLKL